jgi:hypothetical protein
VNVLFNAVTANLTGPFRFVCLTDNAEGLQDGIEAFPIPEMGIPPERFRHGAWPKISILKKDLYGLDGRVVFIDLDTVINGPIDRFFEPQDALMAIGSSTWEYTTKKKSRLFRAWKDWRKRRKAKRPEAMLLQRDPLPSVVPNTMGSGIISFDVGAHARIYDAFMEDRAGAFIKFTNDQHFIEAHLEGWTPWPRRWVLSYKYQLRRPLVLDWVLHPKVPPVDVPVIAFHGDPRPIDMATKWHSSLPEFPHVWIGPVRWMRDYWRRFSRAE